MKVLAGGKAFLEGELKPVDIGFEEEILQIGPDLSGEKIDCCGKIILPAMIDVHVHFRDFLQAHKETWQTGGIAAVKGGVATVMEMPNTDPPTINLEMIRKKRELASRALVNYGIYGGLVPENIDKIPKLAKHVEAFKLYLGETTGGLLVHDPKILKEIFKAVASTGKVLTVHAQRGGLPEEITAKEAEDLEQAIELASRYKVKLQLAHVTTKKGVEVVAAAKKDGLNVTAETCPHYLFFTKANLKERGAFFKVNPPLATEEDRQFLWEALKEGLIDILASDHAPHTLAEKSLEYAKAPSGLPGVETTLPLMLNAVNAGKLSLEKLVELVSLNPAQRFGFSKKGRISLKKDADLVVIDPSLNKIVKREDLATKCGWSPYEGFELTGWPVYTFVKGRLAYSNSS